VTGRPGERVKVIVPVASCDLLQMLWLGSIVTNMVGPFDTVDLTKMPKPIAVACFSVVQEQHPSVKLQRLIDCFEVILKCAATISIQGFYAKKLQERFAETDVLIRRKLQRPKLGDYAELLRKVSTHLNAQPHFMFASVITNLTKTKQFDALLNLRNDFKGHGATVGDSLANAKTLEYLPSLTKVVEAVAPFSSLWLMLVVGSEGQNRWRVKCLQGHTAGSDHDEGITAGSLPSGHVVIYEPQTGNFLDLHPLLVTEGKADDRQRLLFFNGKKRAAIKYLDYASGEHAEFFEPDHREADFSRAFPRPPEEDVRGAVLPPQPSSDIILDLTGQFVGRVKELQKLAAFATGKAKRVLVVVGPPGVGKTSLLAQWAKSAFPLRHFIREGDAATCDPLRIFENLGLQLSNVYKQFGLQWQRPTGNEASDYLNEFRRLLDEVAAKSPHPVVVLIDGLDEAQRSVPAVTPGKSRRTILDWLPDPDTLPANTRWLLSTRPEMLGTDAFGAKFGPDKAEHLILARLSEKDVRAMLYEVCNWYEVAATPSFVKAVVKMSEGSPVYLRLLVEDLSAKRMTLAEAGDLPAGVGAYYERVLESIERTGCANERAQVETQFRSKVQMLERLVADGHLPRERFGQLCKEERELLGKPASISCTEFLALFAVAKEPLTLEDVAAVLGWQPTATERAFSIARTVLEERGEQRYTIFHSAFRAFVLQRRPRVAELVGDKLIEWCSRFRDHHHRYALRYYVAHLCDVVAAHDSNARQAVALAKLEVTLTDLTFIEEKVRSGEVPALLRDYQTALQVWPGYVRYNPFDVPSPPPVERWTTECVKSVLKGGKDPHPDKGAGLVLRAMKRRLAAKKEEDYYGVRMIKRSPVAALGHSLPSRYFSRSSMTSAVISAMEQSASARPRGKKPDTATLQASRIQEFSMFVSTCSHLLADAHVDVLALAYNRASSGAIADSVEIASQNRRDPWIRRVNRPAFSLDKPILLRALPERGGEAVTPDFRRFLVVIGREEEKTHETVLTFRTCDLPTGAELRSISYRFPEGTRLPSTVIDRLAASADLQTVVFGDFVWDLNTADHPLVLDCGKLRAAAVSSDGQLAVTATNDERLSVWNLASGKIVRELFVGDKEIHDLSISPDGKIIAVATHHHDMQLWDVATGQPVLELGVDSHVLSVALTPDARFVVFGTRKGRVWVVDVLKARVLRLFVPDEFPYVYAVAITADGRIACAQDAAGILRMWDIKSGKLLREFPLTCSTRRITLAANGALAVAGAHVLDLKHGQIFPARSEVVKTSICGSVSKDGTKALVGYSDGSASLFMFGESNPLLTVSRFAQAGPNVGGDERPPLIATCVDAKTETGLLAYRDGMLYVVDLKGGILREIISPASLEQLAKKVLPKVERDAARLRGEHRLSKKVRAQLTRPWTPRYEISQAALTPDGRFAVTSCDGDAVRIWDIASGKCFNELSTRMRQSFSEGEVSYLSTTADGQVAVFATDEGTAHFWRFGEDAESVVRNAGEFFLARYAVSPDGRWIVYGGLCCSLELWDASTHQLVRRFDEPVGWDDVAMIAIAPNNRTVLVASGDEELIHQIKAWDMETGTAFATYPLSRDCSSLSNISDNGRFMCCTEDGEIHYLTVDNVSR
jgi:WD40 repeat protein